MMRGLHGRRKRKKERERELRVRERERDAVMENGKMANKKHGQRKTKGKLEKTTKPTPQGSSGLEGPLQSSATTTHVLCWDIAPLIVHDFHQLLGIGKNEIDAFIHTYIHTYIHK